MAAATVAAADRLPIDKRPGDPFPYLLVAPAAVLVGSFTILSLIFTGIISLTDWDVARRGISFIGFNNYVRAFFDEELTRSWARTIVFVLSVTVLSAMIGFLLAVAVNRKFQGQGIVRAMIVVPWVISELATGVFWMILLMPDAPLGAVTGGH